MERTRRTPRNELGLPNVVIPAEVWFHPNLPPRTKMLFGMINNLAYTEKGCWASNKYLSLYLGVRADTISSMISSLEKQKFIFVEYSRRGDGMQVRKITINKDYPKIYDKMLTSTFRSINSEMGSYQTESTKPGRPVRPLGKNPKGVLEKSKRVYGKTPNKLESIIREDITDTKVSASGPTGPDASEPLYDPQMEEDFLSILEYWNRLPNTTQHKLDPDSKVYQQGLALICNLLKGLPLLAKKDSNPTQPLQSFFSKYHISSELQKAEWTVGEIKALLKEITAKNKTKQSLPSVFWSQFARGGCFSTFLFVADKKALPQEALDMADLLEKANGGKIPKSQKIDWAKSLWAFIEDGPSKEELQEVLLWYVAHSKDRYTPKARTGDEFCEKYDNIKEAISREAERPSKASDTSAAEVPKEFFEIDMWKKILGRAKDWLSQNGRDEAWRNNGKEGQLKAAIYQFNKELDVLRANIPPDIKDALPGSMGIISGYVWWLEDQTWIDSRSVSLMEVRHPIFRGKYIPRLEKEYGYNIFTGGYK